MVYLIRSLTLNITSDELFFQVAVLETYPQLIGYDIEVYKYFKEQ